MTRRGVETARVSTYKPHIFAALILMMLAGCGKEGDEAAPTAPAGNPQVKTMSGTSLLGLVPNRTFTYVQADTLITGQPFDVKVTNSYRTVRMSGDNVNIMVIDNNVRILHLRINQETINLSGYWIREGSKDSLVYFAEPPLMAPRVVSVEGPWEDIVPPIVVDSATERRVLYYAYYGFAYRKTYGGVESVLTPGGVLTAHRFDVDLYPDVFTDQPLAKAVEHYIEGVGLVRLKFESGPFRRLLTLVSYSDPSS